MSSSEIFLGYPPQKSPQILYSEIFLGYPPQKLPQMLYSEISSDIILRNPLRYYPHKPPQISSSEILNIVIHYQIVIRKSILFFFFKKYRLNNRDTSLFIAVFFASFKAYFSTRT